MVKLYYTEELSLFLLGKFHGYWSSYKNNKIFYFKWFTAYSNMDAKTFIKSGNINVLEVYANVTATLVKHVWIYN